VFSFPDLFSFISYLVLIRLKEVSGNEIKLALSAQLVDVGKRWGLKVTRGRMIG